MLRRFAVGSCERYQRAYQVLDDLGVCMDTLGWPRRGHVSCETVKP